MKFHVGDTLIYKYKNTLILTILEEKSDYEQGVAANDIEVICGNEEVYEGLWEISKVLDCNNVEIVANTENDYHNWIESNPEYFV